MFINKLKLFIVFIGLIICSNNLFAFKLEVNNLKTQCCYIRVNFTYYLKDSKSRPIQVPEQEKFLVVGKKSFDVEMPNSYLDRVEIFDVDIDAIDYSRADLGLKLENKNLLFEHNFVKKMPAYIKVKLDLNELYSNDALSFLLPDGKEAFEGSFPEFCQHDSSASYMIITGNINSELPEEDDLGDCEGLDDREWRWKYQYYNPYDSFAGIEALKFAMNALVKGLSIGGSIGTFSDSEAAILDRELTHELGILKCSSEPSLICRSKSDKSSSQRISNSGFGCDDSEDEDWYGAC